MNTELVEKEFDDKDLQNRTGNYGKLLTYITYPAYVRRMNEVFDYQWSSDLEQLQFKEEEVIAVVKVTAEGISKTQAGGKKISVNKKGKIISLGDDTKAAISTAFKKACQMFGVGLYLAGIDDEEVAHLDTPARTASRTNGGISEAQLKFIKDLRTGMSMSVEEVQAVCEEMFKTKNVLSLNSTQASTFIQALKVAKQNGGQPEASEAPF